MNRIRVTGLLLARERGPLVGDLMTTGIATVPPWIPIAGARRIAALKSVEHLLVAEEGRVLGLLSTSDLNAAANDDLVGAWTRRPEVSLDPATPAFRALEVMVKNRAPCLPVLAGSFLVGLVTREALDAATAPKQLRALTPRPRAPRRAAA